MSVDFPDRLRHLFDAGKDSAEKVRTMLETVRGLDTYHLFQAARAEPLQRSGNRSAALVAFAFAESLATNPAEKRHLAKRAQSLAG